MSPDSGDNGAVEEENHDHGDHVAEDKAKEDIALGVPVISQVVI